MSVARKRAVVVCPGRGSYGKAELGYLEKHHPAIALFDAFERDRMAADAPSLRALDGAERFSPKLHGAGPNAAPLIHACAYADFLAIDREQIEIVAITGNSMGFYTALACAGALDVDDGMTLVATMAGLMTDAGIGAQALYPITDESWRPDPERRATVAQWIAAIDRAPDKALALSIDLGGVFAIAGDAAGLDAFERQAPRVEDRFPMRLAGHAAFHTKLQAPVAARARDILDAAMFKPPTTPLIDGLGRIWRPWSAEPAALYDYTLGAQVTGPYYFASAIAVAAKEFAPDLFVLLGPGHSLGAAIAQSWIACGWRGLDDRDAFKARQERAPLLAAMGRDDQRAALVAAA